MEWAAHIQLIRGSSLLHVIDTNLPLFPAGWIGSKGVQIFLA